MLIKYILQQIFSIFIENAHMKPTNYRNDLINSLFDELEVNI